MLPLWCMAFATEHPEKNFQTLRLPDNESAKLSFEATDTFFESSQFDLLNGGRSKSPVEKKGSEDPSGPEESEEKEESKEDKDSDANYFHCLIIFSASSILHFNANEIENSLVNTSLYILYHSWKSHLN